MQKKIRLTQSLCIVLQRMQKHKRDCPLPCRKMKKETSCESMHCLAEADEEDQQDERQEAVEAAVKTEYRVWVHTSSCRGAGMQGRVSIELHGQGGSSGLQPLHAANDDAFARSQVTHTHVSLLTQVLPRTPHPRCMKGLHATAHGKTLDILRLAVRARCKSACIAGSACVHFQPPDTLWCVACPGQPQARHLLCACCALEEPLGLFHSRQVQETGVRVMRTFPNVHRYVAWWQSHLNKPCKDVCANNGKSQSSPYTCYM